LVENICFAESWQAHSCATQATSSRCMNIRWSRTDYSAQSLVRMVIVGVGVLYLAPSNC
jgi:hypothetical protein